jgi:hypothetical protein
MHPLLIPDSPVDLALLSEVAMSISDLTLDGAARSSANEILVEFAARPDAFLHVDPILNSDCPPIAKFAVLLSLEEVARDCWSRLPQAERQSLRECLLGQFANPAVPDDLLTKVIDVLIYILESEYPEEWPTFLSETIGHCYDSPEDCRRWFRLIAELVDTAMNDRDNLFYSQCAQRIQSDIAAHFDELGDLMLLVIRESADTLLVRRVLSTVSKLIRWLSGPEFFQSQLFADICHTVAGRPDLAVEAIPVLTESFTFLYIQRDNQTCVGTFFGLIVGALDGLDLAELAQNEFFLTSLSNGFTCVVSHYFQCVSESASFGRMVQMMLDLTQMTGDEAFDAHFNRFWSALIDKDDDAFLGDVYPVILDQYLRKMPSPFAKVVQTDPETGREEVHVTDQFLPTGQFAMRKIIAKDRPFAISAMNSLLAEFVGLENFEGVGRLCFCLGSFVDYDVNEENCSLAAGLLRQLFQICSSISDFDGKVPVAIGIGVFIADISHILVCSSALLQAVFRQLLDFLVSDSYVLQEATLLALFRTLRFIAVDRDHLDKDLIAHLFDDLFERVPQVLETFSDTMIRDFFMKMQAPVFNQFTIRSERLLTLASERIDLLLSDLQTSASYDQLATYFLAFSSSWTMNWRQSAAFLASVFPRYIEFYKFISRTLPDAGDLFDAMKDVKNILTDLFAKAVASPVEGLLPTELFAILLADFAGGDATTRSHATLSLFSNSLSLDVWDQPEMLQQLFDNLVLPTEEMLSYAFDANYCFYQPFAELLLELLQKRLSVLERLEWNAVGYLFDKLIGLISIPCDGRDSLISRIPVQFDVIEYADGEDVLNTLLDRYAITILEVFFQVVFHYGVKTDIFGVICAIQSLLAHPFMKTKVTDVCELVFTLVPTIHADVAQALITNAYEPMNSVQFLESLKAVMLDLRMVTPVQSLDAFDGVRARVIEEMARKIAPQEKEIVTGPEMGGFHAVSAQLQAFSVLGT